MKRRKNPCCNPPKGTYFFVSGSTRASVRYDKTRDLYIATIHFPGKGKGKSSELVRREALCGTAVPKLGDDFTRALAASRVFFARSRDLFGAPIATSKEGTESKRAARKRAASKAPKAPPKPSRASKAPSLPPPPKAASVPPPPRAPSVPPPPKAPSVPPGAMEETVGLQRELAQRYEKEKAAKRESYAKARARFFEALKADGWKVETNLKVPHATSPDGRKRLWFKPQAVWVSFAGRGVSHNMSFARSAWSEDYRGKPSADFVQWANNLTHGTPVKNPQDTLPHWETAQRIAKGINRERSHGFHAWPLNVRAENEAQVYVEHRGKQLGYVGFQNDKAPDFSHIYEKKTELRNLISSLEKGKTSQTLGPKKSAPKSSLWSKAKSFGAEWKAKGKSIL